MTEFEMYFRFIWSLGVLPIALYARGKYIHWYLVGLMWPAMLIVLAIDFVNSPGYFYNNYTNQPSWARSRWG